MASSLEDHAEPSGNHSPPPGMILGLKSKDCDNQDLACTNLLSEIFPSPNKFISSPPRFMPSPRTRDDVTPVTTTVGTQSDQMGRTMESGVLLTPDLATSTGHFGSDMETLSTWYGEGLGLENAVLPDIPELDNSAGDLSFLNQDDDTLIACVTHMLKLDFKELLKLVTYQVSKGDYKSWTHYLQEQELWNYTGFVVDVDCRAVAQFLQGLSPVTPISGKLEISA